MSISTDKIILKTVTLFTYCLAVFALKWQRPYGLTNLKYFLSGVF